MNLSSMVEHQVPLSPQWKEILEKSYKTEVGKLEFSFRIQWRLYYHGYRTLKQLTKVDRITLSKIEGIGPKSIREIVDILSSKGLTLKGEQLFRMNQ